MPGINSAVVQNYDFGAAASASAPAAANAVLNFRVLRGGRLELCFVNVPDNNPLGDSMTVTVQVSPDNSVWTTVTAAKQESAINATVIAAGTKLVKVVDVNAGTDLYLRVLAVGGTIRGVRGQLQIRDGEDKLEISKI